MGTAVSVLSSVVNSHDGPALIWGALAVRSTSGEGASSEAGRQGHSSEDGNTETYVPSKHRVLQTAPIAVQLARTADSFRFRHWSRQPLTQRLRQPLSA